MKQEMEEKEKELSNTKCETVIKSVYKFYDEYIHPRLTRLNKQDIIRYDLENIDKDISKQSNKIYAFAIHTIEMIGRMNELNDSNILHLLGDSKQIMLDDYYIISMIEEEDILKDMECNILTTTDKEYKSMVADAIIETIVMRDLVKVVLRFYKKYILPMLNELNDSGKIIFNIGDTNDSIRNISLKVKDVILQVIMEYNIEMIGILLDNIEEIPDNILKIMKVLYDRDESISKQMTCYFCDSIVKIFNKNDFLNLNVDEILNKIKECAN